MKRIFLIVFIISLSVILSSQNTNAGKYKNLKKLKNTQEEEISVQIRKPDNDALMPRKKTSTEYEKRIILKEKMKHANRLLY